MPFFLKLALLTLLVQSFVLTTVIKGLIITSVSTIIQFLKDIALTKNIGLKIFISFFSFFCFFIFYQCLVQAFNIIYHPELKDLSLISPEGQNEYLFRTSLFTQSIYLFACILFYLYIYNYLKYKQDIEGVLKFARIGVILLILYGFYEFIGFMILDKNIDFLSNRITGDNYGFGLFQTVDLGGLTFKRMTSLAGEPSMFAFSILPFMILFYYLKDKTFILCFIALLCSTSTTAFVGIFFFLLIDALFFRKAIRFTLIASLFIGVIVYLNFDIIVSLYKLYVLKFSLADQSGSDRFKNFYDSFSFFINADPFHFLFGYGFGLIRSTDGISSLLVNIGLIGTLIYNLFFILPVFKLKYFSNYRAGLSVAMVVLIICMLISVPEFYFYHSWFLSALLWYEVFKDKNTAGKVLETKSVS